MAGIDDRYDAFISYNHAADSDLAAAVERGLQRLAKPWYRLRAISVYRDLSDTGLNPGLWGAVQQRLDQTGWLILFACPGSAASRWVEQEVSHWADAKGTDRILIVLTGGEIAWDHDADRFASTTDALSPTVAARFSSEPLHLDLKWTSDVDELSLRVDRFRSDIARLAAPIRGVTPDALVGEDIRLHRKARRLAKGAVALLVTLAIVASIAAVVAVVNARRAEQRAQEALARQVGLLALDMPASQLDRALLVSVVAADLDDGAGVERYRSSRTLLGRHSRLTRLLHAPGTDQMSMRGVAVSPDGMTVAASVPTNAGSEVLTWDLSTGGEVVTTEFEAGIGPTLAFDSTGRIVVGAVGEGLGSLAPPASGNSDDDEGDPSPGAPVIEGDLHVVVDSPVLALDRPGARAVSLDAGQVVLVDLAARRESAVIADWNAGEQVVAGMAGGRAVFVADGVLRLIDTEDGREIAATEVGPVAAVAVTPDGGGERAVAIAPDGGLHLWQPDGPPGATSMDEVAMVGDQVGTARSVALSTNGRRALVVGDNGSVVVDADSGEVVAGDLASGGLVVDPTGRYAAVGGTRLTVWDLVTGQPVLAASESINAMHWSSCDGGTCRLITAGESTDVWEPATRRRIVLADQTNAQSVGISADGSRAVTAGWGTSVALWDIEVPVDDTGRSVRADAGAPSAYDVGTDTLAVADGESVVVTRGDERWAVPTGVVERIHLVDDGTALLSVDASATTLFDIESAEPIELASGCAGDLTAVSPDGTRLAWYRRDGGQIAVCDATGGGVVGHGEVGGLNAVTALAVDDDGGVALGTDGLVAYFALPPAADGEVVELDDGDAIDVRFGDPSALVATVAIRAGTITAGVEPLASAAQARIAVWDAAGNGTPVQFDSDHRDVLAVGLLGDEAEFVAAAGRARDGQVVVQVWEREQLRQLGRGLGGLRGRVVALGGDLTTVVATDSDGRTVTWSLDRDPRREVCGIVGRGLEREEWSTVLGGVLDRYDYDPVCE